MQKRNGYYYHRHPQRRYVPINWQARGVCPECGKLVTREE